MPQQLLGPSGEAYASALVDEAVRVNIGQHRSATIAQKALTFGPRVPFARADDSGCAVHGTGKAHSP